MKTVSRSALILIITIQMVMITACHYKLKDFHNEDESSKYHSAYDDSTLTRATMPLLMPYNRRIEAPGELISWGNANEENHSLQIKPIPGTQYLIVLDRYGITLIDKKLKQVADRWTYDLVDDFKGMMSTYSGLAVLDKDGKKRIFFSAAGGKKHGSSVVLEALIEKGKIIYKSKITFAAEAPSPMALPNGLAIRNEQGIDYLYVVLNGNNKLVKYNLVKRSLVWSSSTGVAPYSLTIAANKIFVTNWAGPDPEAIHADLAGDQKIPAPDTLRASKADLERKVIRKPIIETPLETAGVPYGKSYIDPKTGATLKGTVSVFNPETGSKLAELPVGLHPNDIIHTSDENEIYVASANSDNICVIDTHSLKTNQTLSVMLMPGKEGYIGDSPNSLALSEDGKRLFVANGLDNAIALIDLDKSKYSKNDSSSPKIQVLGFIPTGAYPGSVFVSGDTLYVANLEGIGARVDSREIKKAPIKNNHKKIQDDIPQNIEAFNAHHQLANLSIIQVPKNEDLKISTEKVRAQNLQFRSELSRQRARPYQRPKPMPDRIGEPSIFQHVIYIIKENRSYDQVLGDMKEGRGVENLCIFGNQVTPNQHALATEYSLMDNYYASGKCSAEGHQWTDAAMVTDYVEKSVRAWFRSYPHVQEDALVYDKNGFIWNDAADHGKSVRVYGEACTPHYKNGLNWTDFYSAYKTGVKIPFTNTTTISRVRGMLSDTYPGYQTHDINDQIRASAFIDELNADNQQKKDRLPNLMILALPSDHTGGSSPGLPTPRAMVADNDLALARIVEAVSKSKFWKNTVIFVTEDDSQDGWDHVSAYRTTGFVISAYSHLHKTIHTNYNQTCMVRSIEQILGLPPMNNIDATASPMFDCFTDKPDLSVYHALENQIPLDEMNPKLTSLRGKNLMYAKASMRPEFKFIDGGDDDLLNRIIWNAAQTGRPYPGKNYPGKNYPETSYAGKRYAGKHSSKKTNELD